MNKMTRQNKLLLLVAFLATVAVLFYKLGYDRHAADLLIPSQANITAVENRTATIIDKLPDKLAANSSLLTKSQQTINGEQAPGTQTGNSSATEIVPGQVIRVIDGDTIVVNINALPVHVRLIGINSPELNDKRPQVACLAQKAKEEAEKLINGQNIYLEKDPAQGDYDRYNRLLAYVFLPADSASLPSAQLGTGTTSGVNFNKLMIENGYAYEHTYFLPYKYQREFKDAQAKVRTAQKGLWNPDICRN